MIMKITQKIWTVLTQQFQDHFTNPNDSNPEDSGCLGVTFILLLFLVSLATCSSTQVIYSENTPVYEETTCQANADFIESCHPNLENSIEFQNEANNSLDAAIVIWIDVSGSIGQGVVPRVHPEQLEPILDILEQINGSLALGLLGAQTREQMLFISNSTKKITMPERRDNQDATEYRKDILRWKKRQARQSATLIPFAQKRSKFMNDLRQLLNYSALHHKSLICEGLNLSMRVFDQPNHKDSQRFLLMVTDYYHNGTDEKCPIRLPGDIELISVNRLSNANTPLMYKGEHFVDVSSAINHIINKI